MIVRGTAREELRSAIAALPSDMAAKWPRTLTAPLDPGHGIVDGSAGPVFAEADPASFQTHLTPPRFAKTPSAFPGNGPNALSRLSRTFSTKIHAQLDNLLKAHSEAR
jgi:hypothetical protein